MVLLRVCYRCAFLLLLSGLTGCIYHPVELFNFSTPADTDATNSDASVSTDRASLGILKNRVAVLPAPVIARTPEVDKEIAFLQNGKFLSSALERRSTHHAALSEILRDEGVPQELLNLAIVESGFRTDARSPAGAVGLWQLMKGTAKNYGLKVGLFKDDRKDPILSTLAAARHLKDLYRAYNDWYLALAAYNAGSAKIDRAMTRSGAGNFWELARSGQLRHETVRFVPRFIATTLLVRQQEQLQALNAENGLRKIY